MLMSKRQLYLSSSSEISSGQAFKFKFNINDRKLEGFLINEKGQYFAYINRCRHMGITLDWDTNDFYTVEKDAIICKTHGATYRPSTGECTHGPCLGKSLYSLPLLIQSDQIFLDLEKTEELYSD
jgi:nitrite reductase/ring-hydroxylating ferredoxin subunit